MFKTTFITSALLLVTLCSAVPAFAEDDVTMHQVYLAAKAGKFTEAQAMMDKVLRDHPDSAKAHFVEAELLAKQGLLSKAGAELNTAEGLQPGLPFVKPEILQNLKAQIASVSNGVIQPNVARQNIPATVKDWMPTMLLILGIGFILVLIAYMSRRKSSMTPANNYAGNAPGPNMPTVMGQAATGGMGSGIIGNLATGAAMGAGVVAGEALMHHFIDGDKNSILPDHDNSSWNPANTVSNISSNDDMGGTDFGVADASSWDDEGSSDGGDDWT